MADKPAQAFLSYAHADDKFLDGGITWLCRELQRGMQALTGETFEIFQDADGIAFGEHWPSRIEEALEGARFLVPILTPSYFTSSNCCAEAAAFLDLEHKAGRQDLILPIYLIEADILEDAERRDSNAIAQNSYERQYADWRDAAFELRSSPRFKQRAFELVLPSGSWWEYACLAGSTDAYAFGEVIDLQQVNFGRSLRMTSKVGAYPANAFKLFDMHGNVWERCGDHYHDSYEDAPSNDNAWLDDQAEGLRVVRGGPWRDGARHVRAANCAVGDLSGRLNILGFRCARVQETSR